LVFGLVGRTALGQFFLFLASSNANLNPLFGLGFFLKPIQLSIPSLFVKTFFSKPKNVLLTSQFLGKKK
jgi:hypothetical protein